MYVCWQYCPSFSATLPQLEPKAQILKSYFSGTLSFLLLPVATPFNVTSFKSKFGFLLSYFFLITQLILSAVRCA